MADGTVPAEFAAADLLAPGRARPRWLRGARHVGRRRRRRGRRRSNRARSPARPAATRSSTPSPPAGAPCWSTTRSRRSTSVNEIAPEHLELLTADPDALVPLVRNAGRGVLRPVGAGRGRRLRRRRQPRPAHRAHGAVRQRAPRRHLPQARARRARHRGRPRRGRTAVGGARRGRRARALRRVARVAPPVALRPAHPFAGTRRERPVAPRDDLAALEGYHSPQLDVAVRLNTNESPFAPPPEFVDRWLDELRGAR